MKNLSNKSLLAASAVALLAIGVAANAAAQQRRRAVRPSNVSTTPITSNSGPGGIVVNTTPLNPMSPVQPKPLPTTIPPDF